MAMTCALRADVHLNWPEADAKRAYEAHNADVASCRPTS
jgi:hypothetical protein